MVVKVIKDDNDNMSNSYLGTLKNTVENISNITKINNLVLESYFHRGPSGTMMEMSKGQFFTDYDYFSGRFKLISDKTLGYFTISCFPNCCGMAIITADYRAYSYVSGSKTQSKLTLLIACLIAQAFNYTAITIVDRADHTSAIDAFNYCKFNKIFEFTGKGGSDLRQYSLKNIREIDFIEEIKKLYE